MRAAQRTRGLPRARPPVEQNIIQNPELLQRIATRLGLRQAHISPALTEGLTCVMIVDDLTQRSGTTLRHYHNFGEAPGTIAQAGTYILENPPGSGKVARIKRVYDSSQLANPGTAVQATVHILVPPFVFPPAGGTMALATGFQSSVSQDYGLQLFQPNTVDTPVCLAFVGQTGIITGLHGARKVMQWPHNVNEGDAKEWVPNDLVLRPGSYIAFRSTDTQVGSNVGIGIQWTEESIGDAR